MRVTENLNLEKFAQKKDFRKCYQKCVGLIIKISSLGTSKLSKNELDDILDIFSHFSSINKGFLGFSRMRVTENLNLEK